MIKHFTFENIKKINNKHPLLVYVCPPGAMGPEGLVAALFNKKNLYVANLFRENEKGYGELLSNIFSSIPEFKHVIGDRFKFETKRKIKFNYHHVYLGCGNMVAINPFWIRGQKLESLAI